MAIKPMPTPSADPYSAYNTEKNKKKKQTNLQINLSFARLHYFCDVDGEKSIDARKHFVLSPNL